MTQISMALTFWFRCWRFDRFWRRGFRWRGGRFLWRGWGGRPRGRWGRGYDLDVGVELVNLLEVTPVPQGGQGLPKVPQVKAVGLL